MFILAGSSSFDALPQGTPALTGRLQRLAVMPFTQGEIDGAGSTLLPHAFDGDVAHTVRLATTTREDYVQRVMRGGTPLALAQESDAGRSRWIEA